MKRDVCGENCLEAAKESLGIPRWLQGPIRGEGGASWCSKKLKLVKQNEVGDLMFPKPTPPEVLKMTSREFNS